MWVYVQRRTRAHVVWVRVRVCTDHFARVRAREGFPRFHGPATAHDDERDDDDDVDEFDAREPRDASRGVRANGAWDDARRETRDDARRDAIRASG